MPNQSRVGSRSPHPSARRTSRKESTESLLHEMIRLPDGDPRRTRLRARIVELHVPVARHIARQYMHRGEPIEDIEQSALLGLVKAINRYDPDFGNEFLAYAFPMMTGEVKRHFRDTTWALRVPRRIQELRLVLRETSRDFAQAHGRTPRVAEIATLMDISEEETIEVMSASDAYRTASLDAPIASGDAETLDHCIGDKDPNLEHVVDGQALWPLMNELPSREREILILRFFGNQTQAEIADQVGISQMHVSRLISRSLERLRTELLRDGAAPNDQEGRKS